MVNREFAALVNFLELLILMFGLISAVIADFFIFFHCFVVEYKIDHSLFTCGAEFTV